MTGEHYDDDDLLVLFDEDANANDAEHERLTTHLLNCDGCSTRGRELAREMAAFVAGVREALRHSVRKFAAPTAEHRNDIRLRNSRFAEGELAAAHALSELRKHPINEWLRHLVAPDARLSVRLIQAVSDLILEELIFTAPDDALLAIDIAATAIEHLPESDGEEVWELRSSVARSRSNLLRMLGRLDEARDAAIASESFAAAFPGGGFAYAQARQTHGLVIFAMQRYEEALLIARETADRFREFGDRRRITHAQLLEAACLLEQGRTREALNLNIEIAAELDKLNDPKTSAHTISNIGLAYLRLGDTASARLYTQDARKRFIDLSMDTEAIRTEWILAVVDLREQTGKAEALARLEQAADAFAELRMIDDAASVRLAVLEQMVVDRDWDAAARLAASLAATFAQTGARVDLATAIFILRDAVYRRVATPQLVRNVGEKFPGFFAVQPPSNQ